MTDSPQPKDIGGPVPVCRFADAGPGCELLIPRRFADPKRSAAILEHARRWWRGESGGIPDED